MSHNLPKLGFLGVGWIGRHRLAAVAKAGLAEIAAVADPLPENCQAVRDISPKALSCDSLDALLDQDLDGIVIATPSAHHAGQTAQALERGCAVFCQKPLARSQTEVAEVIAVARAHDRLLGVDMSYRHTRGLQKLRSLVQSGALGSIFAADLVFHNAYGPDKQWYYDPELSGGGCVMDLGVHLVDSALWILQDDVTNVTSRVFHKGNALAKPVCAVEDYATAILDFHHGCAANLACSWNLHAGCAAVIEIAFHGTKGGASFQNIGGSFTNFRLRRFHGTGAELLVEPPDEWGGGAILAWAQQLTRSRQYDPEIENHLKVSKVLDSIYGRPASVPLDFLQTA